MEKTAVRTLALAALAVLALGAAAATIDTAVTGGTGGFGGDGGTSADEGSGSPGVIDTGFDGPGGGQSLGSLCVATLRHPAVIAGLLLALAGVAFGLYRATGSAFAAVAAGVTVGLPGYVLWSFLTVCGPAGFAGGGSGGGSDTFSLPAGGGGLGGESGTVAAPTAVFGLVLAVALIGAVALLFVSTGDDSGEERTADEGADPDVDVREFGRAAGDAADRIEGDAGVANEVYRAWAEMTDLLDVPNPRSSTPGEFAAAAVAAGVAREDAEELTRLFEEVRYGGASATADRERRAVVALRRIEATYAGDDP